MNMKRMRRLLALLLALLLAASAGALAEAAPAEVVAEDAADDASELAEVSLEDISAEEIIPKSYYDEDNEVYVLNSSSGKFTAAVDETFTIDLDDAVADSSWKSSNKKVATVSDGEVTCVGAGTTSISVKARKIGRSNGSTRTLKLTVVDPYAPESIALAIDIEADAEDPYYYDDEDEDERLEGLYLLAKNEKVKVVPGESFQLTALILPEEAADAEIKWTSSNKKVATVTDEGFVVAKARGTAKITAKTSNDKSMSMKVSVERNRHKYSYSKDELLYLLNEAVDANEVRLLVKNVEVESDERVNVTFYCLNGTSEKINRIYDANITVNGGYVDIDDEDDEIIWDDEDGVYVPVYVAEGEFLSGTFSSIKVDCKSYDKKEFKVTFKNDAVLDTTWHMYNDNFICSAEMSF